MSRWQEVLDYQVELCEFWQSGAGGDFAAGFWKDRLKKNPEEAKRYGYLGETMRQQELLKMMAGEPIWVSPDIQTIIEAAAENFEPEPLQPSDLVTDHGFALFPRPFLLKDVLGKMTTFRAFAWYPAGTTKGPTKLLADPDTVFASRGITISLYSHTEDWELEDPDYQEGARESEQRLTLLHTTPWFFDQPLPGEMDEAWLQRADVSQQAAYQTYSGMWRIVQTFFRLSMQQMTTRERQISYRPARRRAQRFNMPSLNTDYTTVIQLRRPYAKDEENAHDGGAVNWTHRWVVHGFWRKQWYPSLKMHRQIYINDHIKGPDNLPLVVRKGRAFEFVR